MDPATTYMLASAGLGAAGSLLGGSGDPSLDLKDKWGRKLAPDIRELQYDLLDLDPLQFYPDQTFANLNPFQQQAYLGMAGYGNDWQTGGQVENAQLGAGLSGIDSMLMGNDYLADIMSGGSPQFDQGGVFDQVYNNPNLPGMVDAATRDTIRNLEWNTLPGIDTAASQTGNMASSRAGVAQGIASGMAQDRVSDITADIYNNAFNQATEAALAQDRTALSGAGNMARLGLSGLSDAYSTGADNLQLQLGGGTGFQNQLQKSIDEDMARFNFDQMAPRNNYTEMLGLLNSTLPGGPVVNNGMNWMDQLLSGAQVGLGVYDAFSGIGGPSSASGFNMTPYAGDGFQDILSPSGMSGAGFGVIPGYG